MDHRDDDLVLLDCTLRDGGFYTAWDFDPDLVAAYLCAVDAAGVDYAEIGYRSLGRSGFFGAWKYSDDWLVDTLPELHHTRLAVMIDAKEFTGDERRLAKVFRPADRSRIELVRFATKRAHLGSTVEQVKILEDLGYDTTINLMALASIPPSERAAPLAEMAASRTGVVYVADSYGSMLPEDIRQVAELYRGISDKTWGVHLHNNLELAFANALTAMELGARWVDSSVTGMGRGPGNLKTELLVQHLETHRGLERFRTEPLYVFIGRYLATLYEEHRWGPSPPYVLSGHLAVHPTFAQALVGTGRYTVHEVAAILQTLHDTGTGGSFTQARLDAAISRRHELTRDSDHAAMAQRARPLSQWRGADWRDREVLIIGRGPALARHTDAVNRYIAAANPIVIECNHLPQIAPAADHASAFVVLSNARTLAKEAAAQGKAVLLGTTGGIPPLPSGHPVYRARYRVQGGQLAFGEEATIPADVVSMFAIAQAVRFGATRVSVVGFDGYADSVDERERRMQSELVEFFELLGRKSPGVTVTSLLPTSFPIPVRSVYGALFHGVAGDDP